LLPPFVSVLAVRDAEVSAAASTAGVSASTWSAGSSINVSLSLYDAHWNLAVLSNVTVLLLQPCTRATAWNWSVCPPLDDLCTVASATATLSRAVNDAAAGEYAATIPGALVTRAGVAWLRVVADGATITSSTGEACTAAIVAPSAPSQLQALVASDDGRLSFSSGGSAAGSSVLVALRVLDQHGNVLSQLPTGVDLNATLADAPCVTVTSALLAVSPHGGLLWSPWLEVPASVANVTAWALCSSYTYAGASAVSARLTGSVQLESSANSTVATSPAALSAALLRVTGATNVSTAQSVVFTSGVISSSDDLKPLSSAAWLLATSSVLAATPGLPLTLNASVYDVFGNAANLSALAASVGVCLQLVGSSSSALDPFEPVPVSELCSWSVSTACCDAGSGAQRASATLLLPATAHGQLPYAARVVRGVSLSSSSYHGAATGASSEARSVLLHTALLSDAAPVFTSGHASVSAPAPLAVLPVQSVSAPLSSVLSSLPGVAASAAVMTACNLSVASTPLALHSGDTLQLRLVLRDRNGVAMNASRLLGALGDGQPSAPARLLTVFVAPPSVAMAVQGVTTSCDGEAGCTVTVAALELLTPQTTAVQVHSFVQFLPWAGESVFDSGSRAVSGAAPVTSVGSTGIVGPLSDDTLHVVVTSKGVAAPGQSSVATDAPVWTYADAATLAAVGVHSAAAGAIVAWDPSALPSIVTALRDSSNRTLGAELRGVQDSSTGTTHGPSTTVPRNTAHAPVWGTLVYGASFGLADSYANFDALFSAYAPGDALAARWACMVRERRLLKEWRWHPG
jgi:hypothetical protein